MKPKIISDEINADVSRFNKDVKQMQNDFANELTKTLANLETDASGRLTNTPRNIQVATNLQAYVNQINSKIGLTNSVSKYLANIDDINQNITLLHKEINGLNIAKAGLDELKAWAINNATYTFQGGGMDASLVQPLRQLLTRNILIGSNLTETIDQLRLMAQGDGGKLGAFERYFTTASRDLLFQYQGTVNNKIANQYELDGIMYVGSLIEDSRPQCERWVLAGTLAVKDLQSEIDWAFKNGSGMISGTDPTNFCQYRGGYACRHEAFPIRL